MNGSCSAWLVRGVRLHEMLHIYASDLVVSPYIVLYNGFVDLV
jgi:hypothetical protein